MQDTLDLNLPIARLTVSDAMCELSPWVSELERPLSYNKRIAKSPSDYYDEVKEAAKVGTATSVSRFISERKNLYSVDKTLDVGRFLPGMLKTVEQELTRRGISYRIDDRRSPAIRPEPAWANAQMLRGQQLEILAAITIADGGIVDGCTGVGKSYIIRQLALIYPTLNILVVTKRADVVDTLYRSIAEALPDDVGALGAGYSNVSGKRVVVTTTKSMAKIDPAQVHLLLFDEVHCVGDNDVATQLSKFMFCRRFGFTATLSRADGTIKMIEAFFGPTIAKVTYEEAVQTRIVTPIAYVIQPANKGPKFIDDNLAAGRVTSDLFKKRYGYWLNYSRNDAIALLATQLVDCGHQTLIMVETLEHAIMLREVSMAGITLEYDRAFDSEEFNDVVKSVVRSGIQRKLVESYAESNGLDISTRDGKLEAARKYAEELYSRSVPVISFPRTGTNGFMDCARNLVNKCKAFKGIILDYAMRTGHTDPLTPEELEQLSAEYISARYCLNPSQKAYMKFLAESGRMPLAIATMTWSEGVNIAELTAVIRGDGMSSEVIGAQVPGRLSRLFSGKSCGYLFDFTDGFSKWSGVRSGVRESVYRKQKWKKITMQEVLNASIGGNRPGAL